MNTYSGLRPSPGLATGTFSKKRRLFFSMSVASVWSVLPFSVGRAAFVRTPKSAHPWTPWVVVVAWCVFLSGFCVQGAEPAPAAAKAKEILAEAFKKASEFETYYAEQTAKGGAPQPGLPAVETMTKTYLKKRPDGQQFMRAETVANAGQAGAQRMVMLQNAEGTWQLYLNSAILLKFQANLMKDITQGGSEMGPRLAAGTQFDLAEKQINGVACYVVDQILSQEQIAAQRKIVEATLGKSGVKPPENFELPIVAKTQYWISKSDNLIRRQYSYTAKGDVFQALEFQNIKINVPIEDDLFQVPGNMKKFTANTSEEFANILVKMMGNE